MQGGVLVMRGALPDLRGALVAEMLSQGAGDSALADARLSRDVRRCSQSLDDAVPAIEELRQLGFPSDERRQPTSFGDFQSVHDARGTHDARCLSGTGDALEDEHSKRLCFEVASCETLGLRADQNRSGLCCGFQSGGDVGHLTDDGVLLAGLAAAHLTGYHKPAVNADADLQGHAEGLLEPVTIEFCDSFHDPQCGVNRTMRVVLVGSGIAEVDQKPVAHVLSGETSEALGGVGAYILVGDDDVSEIFRIEAFGEGSGADKVAEQDGDVAPLASVGSRDRVAARAAEAHPRHGGRSAVPAGHASTPS